MIARRRRAADGSSPHHRLLPETRLMLVVHSDISTQPNANFEHLAVRIQSL